MWSAISNSFNQAVTSASNAVSRLSAFPEEVACTKCHHILPVPASTFVWSCTNGHQATPTDTVCPISGCGRTKKESVTRGMYRPVVRCTECDTDVPVPELNFNRHLKEAVSSAPRVIKSGVTRIATEIGSLGKTPQTFPCMFCSSVLSAPTGPWVCQIYNCGNNNPENSLECTLCHGNRFALGVLCGICGRSTPVPHTRLSAGFSSAISQVSQSTAKSYKYASGNAYVDCKNCHVAIVPTDVEIRTALGLSDKAYVPNPRAPAPTEDEDIDEEEQAKISDAAMARAHRIPQPVTTLCKNCLRPCTFTGEDIICRGMVRKNNTPQADPEPVYPMDNKCHMCTIPVGTLTTRARQCTGCHLTFCSKHAPYFRHNVAHSSKQLTFCLQCVMQFDEQKGLGGDTPIQIRTDEDDHNDHDQEGFDHRMDAAFSNMDTADHQEDGNRQ